MEINDCKKFSPEVRSNLKGELFTGHAKRAKVSKLYEKNQNRQSM